MLIRIFRSFVVRFFETLVSVLIVLAFFSVFLTVLNVLFPVGSGLKAMMGTEGYGSKSFLTEISARDLLLTRGNVAGNFVNREDVAAVITMTRNEVKSKRASSIAWRTAEAGMQLFDYDSVQTFVKSAAVIKFDEDSFLRVGASSLVIIKRLEQDFLFHEKRSFVVVADGEFEGKFFGSKQAPVYIEVETPNAVARIRTRKVEEGPAEFKVSVNPDESSIFTVFNGTAVVEAQEKHVKLEENQRTFVGLDAAPSLPRDLPDPVMLVAPVDSNTYYYRDLPPKIMFRWKELPGSDGYRFIMAGDPFFENVVVDERLSRNSFTLGNLKEGTYFWRVSTFEGWEEGVFSKTRKIEVIQDRKPPILTVEYPPDTVYEDKYVMKGITEPGTRIFVAGSPVTTSDSGIFQHVMNFQRGVNVVVVEAMDKAGNVTYSSKLVNGKF